MTPLRSTLINVNSLEEHFCVCLCGKLTFSPWQQWLMVSKNQQMLSSKKIFLFIGLSVCDRLVWAPLVLFLRYCTSQSFCRGSTLCLFSSSIINPWFSRRSGTKRLIVLNHWTKKWIDFNCFSPKVYFCKGIEHLTKQLSIRTCQINSTCINKMHEKSKYTGLSYLCFTTTFIFILWFFF